jgi:hypothetical protein
VAAGQDIAVDITWRLSDWTSPVLHKALDCVYVNGRYVPELSGGVRLPPNDGHFGYRYVVPDVPPGSTICDQGFVSGPNGFEDYAREVSNVVCFPVAQPAPPPPSPAPAPPAEEETTTTVTTERPPAPELARTAHQIPTETEGETLAAPAAAPAELPRTGGGTGPARSAAAALGLAALSRRASRRRPPRPPRPAGPARPPGR